MANSCYTKYGFGFDKIYHENNFKEIKIFVLDSLIGKKDELVEKIHMSQNPNELAEALGEDVSTLIATVINERENITLFEGFPANGDYPEALGMVPLFPWQLTNEDKAVTVAKATDILNKYREKLGIPDEPDYFVQEYYC